MNVGASLRRALSLIDRIERTAMTQATDRPIREKIGSRVDKRPGPLEGRTQRMRVGRLV